MKIELKNISKRYSDEWILRNINFSFSSNSIYGIEGSNGSGKSTLIKIIAGYLSPSLGTVRYFSNSNETIERDEIYRSCSIWGPYCTLLQQMKVDEIVDYYYTFKGMRNTQNRSEFLQSAGLASLAGQAIHSLSSGQTQKLGLALCIFSDSELVLLDEPGSFLDKESTEWLYRQIEYQAQERIFIISSNEPQDLAITSQRLNVEDF